MSEVSQTVKNFLTQFELEVVPYLNKGFDSAKISGTQLITCYVSATTLLDPQFKELIGISSGNPTGSFMGVTIVGKPDMTVEKHYET